LGEKIIRYRDQKRQRKKSSESFMFERRIKHTTPPLLNYDCPKLIVRFFMMHVYRRLAHSVKAVKMSIEVQPRGRKQSYEVSITNHCGSLSGGLRQPTAPRIERTQESEQL